MTVKEFIETFVKKPTNANCTIYPCGVDYNNLNLSDVQQHYNHYALGWIINLYNKDEIQWGINFCKQDYDKFGDLWIRKYVPTEKWDITPEKLLNAEIKYVCGNSSKGGLALIVQDYRLKKRDDTE